MKKNKITSAQVTSEQVAEQLEKDINVEIVTRKEYLKEKKAFFKKNNNDYYERAVSEYGRHCMTYSFRNKESWNEVTCPEYVTRELEVNKVKVTVKIRMLRTEFWNTEDSSVIKCFYEEMW